MVKLRIHFGIKRFWILLVIIALVFFLYSFCLLTAFANEPPIERAVFWDGVFESVYGDAIEKDSVFATFYDEEGNEQTLPVLFPENMEKAGRYTLTVASDNPKYRFINATHSFIVEPKEVELDFSALTDRNYDGNQVFYTPAWKGGGISPNAGDVIISYGQNRTNVGEAQISVSFANTENAKNFKFKEGSPTNKTVKITDAEVQNAKIIGYRGTYDGKAHSAVKGRSGATVDGSPISVTYATSLDGEFAETAPEFTNAGQYTVYYKIAAANHKETMNSFTVMIDPIEATVVWSDNLESTYGIAINNVTATFDGGQAFIEGLPSDNADVGTYFLSAYTDNVNYTLKNASAKYIVTPKEVAVSWQGTFSNMRGQAVNGVTASFDGLEAKIEGVPSKNADAGSYILTASTDNKNYILTNTTRLYEVVASRSVSKIVIILIVVMVFIITVGGIAVILFSKAKRKTLDPLLPNEEECRKIGMAVSEYCRKTAELKRLITNYYVKKNWINQETASALSKQMETIRQDLIESFQNDCIEEGTSFDSATMELDPKEGDLQYGQTVNETVIPGKRIGNWTIRRPVVK